MTPPVNHVAICNRSGGLLSDVILAAFVESYREALPEFCRAWSLPIPGLAIYETSHHQVPEEEACLFVVNSAGDPGTFGAHTMFGKAVWGYLDVGLCQASGEPISRVFGHELFELVADPGLDRWADVGGGERVALEVCDPTQRQSTPRMASFFGHSSIVEQAAYCLPSFYSPAGMPPFDSMGVVTAPLAVADGGYLVRRKAGFAFADGASKVTSFGRTHRRLTSAGG